MISREERLKLWDELERRLSSLVASLATLDDKDRDSVLHFVEHREYGLALEDLCAALKERGAPLLPEHKREIQLLAEKMKLKLDASGKPQI